MRALRLVYASVPFAFFATFAAIATLAAAIAFGGCAVTPASQARVDQVEEKVDKIARDVQVVAAATQTIPGIGTVTASAAAVSTGIAGVLHVLVESLRRKNGNGSPPPSSPTSTA